MDALPETILTEYRLLEAYHSRRKSRSSARPGVSLQCDERDYGGVLPQSSLFMTKQRAAEAVPMSAPPDTETCEFEDVADKLTHIVDSLPLAPKEDVLDSDDVIKRLVELLKESGDKLNQEILRDRELSGYLETAFSYEKFESLASAFIRVVVPKSSEPSVAEKKTQIAWTFEMTSRLGALHLQPMNRSVGFGAKYLHQHFAPWIHQHGGWEKVFNDDESDEEIQ